MSEKITATSYCENPNSLEVYYLPYDSKMKIVDTIIQETISKDRFPKIDTATLHEISDITFITSLTNIDMMAKDEDGLSGYDTLLKNQKLQSLIDEIYPEYSIFSDIMDMKIDDMTNMTALVTDIYNIISQDIGLVSNVITNIDAKKVGTFIGELIQKNIEKYGTK